MISHIWDKSQNFPIENLLRVPGHVGRYVSLKIFVSFFEKIIEMMKIISIQIFIIILLPEIYIRLE